MSGQNRYEGVFVFDPPAWLLLDSDDRIMAVTTTAQSLGEIKTVPVFTEEIFAERFVKENKADYRWQEHATWHDLESNLDPAAKLKDGPTHVAIDPGQNKGRFFPIGQFLQYIKDRIAEEN